ncbi:DUF2878 domain-containing protein, partial [uncultured Lamprocystis sp.]
MSSRVIVNFVAYQVAWFACVLGGAHGLPWVGVAVTAAAVVILLVGSPAPWRDAALITAVAAIGALWDGLLAGLGLLVYPSGMILPWLAPVWIIAMWAGFATTFYVSMRWLLGRWWLASLFGAIGGPLAFYAGMRLGAVSFPNPVAALAVLAVGWAVLMPLTAWIAVKLEADPQAPTPAAANPQPSWRPRSHLISGYRRLFGVVIAFAPDIQTDLRVGAGLKPAPTSGYHVRWLYHAR